MTDVLVVDNYDSFTWNLAQLLGALGADASVVRNDATDLDGVRAMDPDGIVVSPGPGHPARDRDLGVSRGVLRDLPDVPLLGVCLGLQGLAHVHGADVVRAPELVHGRAAAVDHDGAGVLRDLPRPFEAGRYHSLVVDPATLPPELEVTARGPRGEVMALRHADRPHEGVQFHPESILTPDGPRVIENFLEACA